MGYTIQKRLARGFPMSDESQEKKKTKKTRINDKEPVSTQPSEVQDPTPSDFIEDLERKLEGENLEKEKLSYLKRLPRSVKKRYFSYRK
jgi:hypothetical protein